MRIYPIKGPDHPLIKFFFKPFLLRLCPLTKEENETRDQIVLVIHIKASNRSLVLLNMYCLKDGDNRATENCAGAVKLAACLSDLLWK